MNLIHSISEIQESVRNILSENVYFAVHGIPILIENSKDIDFEIKSAISKIGTLITVVTPSLSFRGNMDDSHPFWMMENCQIVVAETPVLNRGRANYSTALDTALQVAETLNEKCHFSVGNITQSEQQGVVFVTVVFKTNIGFKYEKNDIG